MVGDTKKRGRPKGRPSKPAGRIDVELMDSFLAVKAFQLEITKTEALNRAVAGWCGVTWPLESKS